MPKEARIILFFIISMIIMFLSLITFAGAGQSEEMTVEANIFANIETVSIQIPDYVFLGNVTKGESTNKMRIEINNTGNTDITVTPSVKNSSEVIFNYLYFGTAACANSCEKIGNYSINIDKPTLSAGYRNASVYMKLDLTNYPEDIPQDMIGHRANIVFTAMKQ